MKTFYPGTRLKVFNSRVYQNDVDTPLSMTMQWATVVHWYGEETRFGRYPSLIDVVFDGETRVSSGHFTD
jgi:hypothetical protein